MEVANPVLTHLRAKTRALARLRETTREFAQAFALEGLAAFERRRARLITVITLHDRRIADEVAALSPAERTASEFLAAVREESAQQEALIHAVLGEDERILSAVRSAQIDLAREISRTSKQSQDLNRFKSEWVARSGEGIDSRA